eukprot:EG_transcript_18479
MSPAPPLAPHLIPVSAAAQKGHGAVSAPDPPPSLRAAEPVPRPAHVTPLYARTAPNPVGPTGPGVPPPRPESAEPVPPALQALEADLSKARHTLRACALPSPTSRSPSAAPDLPICLLDMLRALNSSPC